MKKLLLILSLIICSCITQKGYNESVEGKFYVSSGSVRMSGKSHYRKQENTVVYISSNYIAFYYKDQYRNTIIEVEPRAVIGNKRSYSITCNNNQVITLDVKSALLYVDSINYKEGAVDRYLYYYDVRKISPN